MENPIQPMPRKTFNFVRKIRLLIFLAATIGIGYLFFSLGSNLGIGLTVLSAILWYVEIARANGTEDYIIENYDNPLT